MTKVFLFGIDGASPELIFDKWLDDLPNIKKLMQKGSYAKLNSTIPPVTILAWSALFSGKDPSELGVFSYTYKNENNETKIVNSGLIKTTMLWDILSENNKQCIVLNSPLTYPVKPIKGIMTSGFLTPSLNEKSVFPKRIIKKIDVFEDKDLFFDISTVAGYKSFDPDSLLNKVYKMTKMQITLLKDLIVNEKWDFLAQVMIGSDRLQHMLWNHFDETHRRFIPDSPHKNSLKEYYMYLDKELGEIIKLLDSNTNIIVTSDHGMVKQEGKININNWLMEKGYLFLTPEFEKEISTKKTKIRYEGIDWKKTIAHGTGAYHARIFLNKKNVKNYNQTREKLIRELKKIKDDKGNELKTKVYKKEIIYKNPSVEGCPDLTVYFDELRWASNPDFGISGLYSWKTAFGADNAGHSKQGSFVISGPNVKTKGHIKDVDIYQITPTILKIMNIPIPKELKYKPISKI